MGDIGSSELKEKLDDKLWGEDEKDEDKEDEVSHMYIRISTGTLDVKVWGHCM